MKLDSFESDALRAEEVDAQEKLGRLGASFASQVKPENGLYGVNTVDKGNGLTEVTGKNAQGQTYRDYFADGRLYKRRVSLGNREWETVDFDDNGNAYMKTTSGFKGGEYISTGVELEKNVTAVKGNYSVKTDGYGRPILNRMEDLQLKEPGSPRRYLSNNLRDDSFRKIGDKFLDDRGHLIPDEFGGPATKDNIVPQLDKVNRKSIRDIERVVKELKKGGHRVDYEMKTNYIGDSMRPSSFEPRIMVDGEEYKLPVEQRKIFNTELEGGAVSQAAKRAAISVGEHIGLSSRQLAMSNELGMKSGALAAGLTFSVSAYDNVSSFVCGEITAEQMVTGIVGDTALAGGVGHGTTFVSTAVSQAMSKSSCALIERVGGSCAPAAIVAFGVESFEDISAFAQGEIDANELAYNLGENAAGVGGGLAGGALMGAAVGSVAGPVGAAVGGVIGGVIGCAIATEAYATAVEIGSQGIDALAERVDALSQTTIDAIADAAPEQIANTQDALNTFFGDNGMPFSV